MNEPALPAKKRECLIVCGDAAAITALQLALHSLALSGQIARTLEEAAPALQTEQIGIVVLDAGLAGAQEFMALVRDYCARTNAISVVFQPPEGSYLRGATLVGVRPLTPESAKQYLRSALNLTRPARRRTLRICLEPLVHLTCNGNTERRQIADISETGLAIRGERLPRGAEVKLRLLLPGMKSPLEATGAVSRPALDRTGIRFGNFATPEQEQCLRDWLAYIRDYSRRVPASAKPASSHHPGNAAMSGASRHHRSSYRRSPEPQRSGWGRMWRTIVSR